MFKIGNDVGIIETRNIIGVICSELIAICIGIYVRMALRSIYAILFFLPLVLKLISLMFCVRRQNLVWPEKPDTEAASDPFSRNDTHLLELNRERDTDDFILITGSEALLSQFSLHHGHPLRNGPNDRINEVVSMLLVVAFAMVFPVSLIASIRASEDVQRIWLRYQAFAIISMLASRFLGNGLVGSTESRLADKLKRSKKVALVDGEGKGVEASLHVSRAESVAEGKVFMEMLIADCKRQM